MTARRPGRDGVRPRLAVVAAAVAALLAPLGAQHISTLELLNPSGPERIHCNIAAYSGPHTPGGYGWARFTLTNPNDRAKNVALTISNPGMPLFSARAAVTLEPGARRTVILPSAAMGALRVEVDGTPWRDEHVGFPMWGGSAGGMTIGVIGTASATSNPGLQVMGLTPEDLPDRWWLLSTLDGLVLGKLRDAASLTPERQSVLADWVSGGGVLIVQGLDADALPAGPLKTAITAALAMPGESAPSGLGRYVTSGDGNWGIHVTNAGRFGAQPMRGLLEELPIPTVSDDVPVGMFMTLLVLFALAVGIQAVVLLRSKRGVLLLCTIPATGLGLSAVVLAYGFFGQGLGIQGVIRSFTILDQRSHRAVAMSQRSLFAGLSPGRIALGDGTLVANDDGRVAFEFGGEVSVSGNSLLRPRRTTTIGVVSVGPARERLRFRRLADGNLSCISDGVLATVPDAVVLKDFEGKWYVSGVDGVLHPAADGKTRVATVLRRFEAHYPKSRSLDVPQWIASQLDADLPKGSYVAAVAGTGTVTDFGLDVEWHRADHLVHGLLAPEDFDG